MPRRLCMLAAALWFVTPAPGALGQETTLAVANGPRFFRATEGGAPIEIDVRSAAVMRRTVSLDFDRPTISLVLAAIERQTGIRFMYNEAVLPGERPVQVQARRISVAGALMELLVDTGLDVVLSARNQVALVKRDIPIAVSQVGAMTGRVTNKSSGTPLTGASVTLDGGRYNATTDDDGRYRLGDIAPGRYIARARYIGFAPGVASVTITDDEEITTDFALERSVQRLNDVVTTGTVVPTEVKALPSPITVITAADIAERNVQRVDQLFRGDVPGALAWIRGRTAHPAARSSGARPT